MYDVSKFVARHPGGMEQIMMGVGRDVTAVFESYHSFDVYKLVCGSTFSPCCICMCIYVRLE